MAQANSGMSWSYTQAEIGDHVGKLASLRAAYPTPLQALGATYIYLPAERAQSGVFQFDFPPR
jgi:hypothetical protein